MSTPMSAEIRIQVPSHHPLYASLADGLTVAVTPILSDPTDAKQDVAEVVAASDLPRSPTLGDASALRGLKCAVDLGQEKSSAVYVPGLLSDPVYEKAFCDELQTVFSENNSEPKWESDGELLQRLGTDASLWADEFLKLLRDNQLSLVSLEKIIVFDWFANAIAAGYAAGAAATLADNATTGSGESVEPTDDPNPDAARQAQYEHLLYAAKSASTAQWESERLVLEHLRSCAATGDFNISIRTVINGGFIVVSTSSGESNAIANTATDLFTCSTPVELLSAIALICAFTEHG